MVFSDLLQTLSAWNDTSMFHVYNSVFVILLFINFYFMFLLFRQRLIDNLNYTKEVLNTHPANILYSDNWSSEELPVFIIIPGNPGQAGFYAEYLRLIVKESKAAFRGCVVSHVGHSPPSAKVFNIKEQVDSKIAFITSKLKPGTSITLVGHSLGSYIALKILERGIKIDKAILILPTIENLAQMPKAETLISMLKFQRLIIGIAWLTGLLPGLLRKKMIQFYAAKFSKDIQDHESESITELIGANALRNVFALAQNELDVIKDIDYKLIKKFEKKLVFYYGMFDLWAPLDCCRRLRKTVPGVNVHIADDDVAHAFMFNSCEKVAVKTVQFMTGDAKYDMSNLIPDLGAKVGDEYDFCDD